MSEAWFRQLEHNTPSKTWFKQLPNSSGDLWFHWRSTIKLEGLVVNGLRGKPLLSMTEEELRAELEAVLRDNSVSLPDSLVDSSRDALLIWLMALAVRMLFPPPASDPPPGATDCLE